MSPDKIKVTVLRAAAMDPRPLFVVETEANHYLGTLVHFDLDHFRVFTGLAGRPAILRYDEVEDMFFASQHQGVTA